MASRPPSLTKKPHHAEPLRFETRLRIYSAVLCGIILILLTVLLIIEHFSATTILSILTIVIVAMLRAVAAFMDQIIRPLITGNPVVDYIGEIADHEKSDFLSGALGLLVPIDWPEPFGLVMIEAMACGTPVLAYNRGSVPEIVEDGLTGFVVDDDAGAVAALDPLLQLSRAKIRERFEQRFTARRMAEDYLDVYSTLVGSKQPQLRLVTV